MEVNSHEDSADNLCRARFFSMRLSEFVSKAMKLLLTEQVGQCRNILLLAFSACPPFGRSIRKRPWVIYSCTDFPLS